MAQLSIGQIADRTGLSVSAIRFYETQGLVRPIRNNGKQRRFRQSDIRRLSFVLIAQQLGFPLEEISELLKSLPESRTPTVTDWALISTIFREALDQRIETALQMRDRLDGCIGCGCLSLTNCALYNPEDRAKGFGSGPRYLMGDLP